MNTSTTITRGGASVTIPVDTTGEHYLTSGTVQFHTLDEDKDADTLVTVTVRDRNKKLAANVSDYFGHWSNGEWSKEIPLDVNEGSELSNICGGEVRVSINPNGHDTWAFTMHIQLQYSEGYSVKWDANYRIALKEDYPDWTDGVNC